MSSPNFSSGSENIVVITALMGELSLANTNRAQQHDSGAPAVQPQAGETTGSTLPKDVVETCTSNGSAAALEDMGEKNATPETAREERPHNDDDSTGTGPGMELSGSGEATLFNGTAQEESLKGNDAPGNIQHTQLLSETMHDSISQDESSDGNNVSGSQDNSKKTAQDDKNDTVQGDASRQVSTPASDGTPKRSRRRALIRRLKKWLRR